MNADTFHGEPCGWWCLTHQRKATHVDMQGNHRCSPELSGILLPCEVAFVSLHQGRQKVHENLERQITYALANEKFRTEKHFVVPVLVSRWSVL